MFSLVSNLLLPLLGVDSFIWLGPTWTLFYVVTISIAIVRHQLFDIKMAAVRSIAYIGVLLTLTLVYYVVAYLASVVVLGGGSQVPGDVSLSPVYILSALVLAVLFQPIKLFFDKLTDDIFYRDNYKSEDFFASLSLLLTSTTELRGLLERASKELASTFKSEQAMFLLYYTNEVEHHMSAGTRKHAKIPQHDAALLDDYAFKNPEAVFLTGLLEDDSKVRRMLVAHKIALVMPLRQADRVIGYVMLGERLSGNYTNRDINVLLTVSNELVIAIQNALSLHEVKELNATLQQRINVATRELRSSNAQLKHLDEVKDEFMSMASHQLRTPLTSIKGYISMVLEGDAGNITLQQQKLLVEAFKSSERMVGLINDFLNVSRLQTGKFIIEKTPFDLGEVVRQEVFDLNMIANTHDIKLRLDATREKLPVKADESKIRQVIMNYIDNAIYYSHAKSTIVIHLEKTGNNAVLTVVDTGIGV
ncbi:GAF domain-containing protein, partial [Candidatus Saccharibacteria bacterium]|nr:GAF domain-containing protein [Candidatus Saccharibacteria bacterium]